MYLIKLVIQHLPVELLVPFDFVFWGKKYLFKKGRNGKREGEWRFENRSLVLRRGIKTRNRSAV